MMPESPSASASTPPFEKLLRFQSKSKIPARARITDADPAEAEASPLEDQPETRLKVIPEPEKAAEVTSKAWPVPKSSVRRARCAGGERSRRRRMGEQSQGRNTRRFSSCRRLPTQRQSSTSTTAWPARATKPSPSPARPNDDEARSRILRAGFAIVRRLAIWEPLHTMALEEASANRKRERPIPSSQTILADLRQAQAELARNRDSSAWRKYLLLDQLQELCSTGAEISPAERKLARDILYRFHSTQLSTEQAALLEQPALRKFAEQSGSLGLPSRWTCWPWRQPLKSMKRTKGAFSAIAVAEMYDLLRWSSEAETSDSGRCRSILTIATPTSGLPSPPNSSIACCPRKCGPRSRCKTRFKVPAFKVRAKPARASAWCFFLIASVGGWGWKPRVKSRRPPRPLPARRLSIRTEPLRTGLASSSPWTAKASACTMPKPKPRLGRNSTTLKPTMTAFRCSMLWPA